MSFIPEPFFQAVLIANRGEIAVRIARTCRVLGIRSVAVYSEVDAGARHVLEADEAVLIGPAAPAESYLKIEAILDAARKTKVCAIHPGYGFLSENAVFARACADAGFVFVGPSAEMLEGSSDKLIVKKRVADAGVPVIPGPLGAVPNDDASLRQEADATGYPLLLKAAAGGGGKGMRRVNGPEDLVAAAEGARREAGGAFGSTVLYMERIIEPARHVEVQVLCDDHGNVRVLGERDCSMQRRHQKVIEECPAPALDDATRARLHEAGAGAARALDYRNAGTVEFLLGPDGQVHFLEVNRRLQVEHPVTERCFGIDLVAWQLRVAAGAALPENLVGAPQGHALEARVYAEDPASGFLPSAGKVLLSREPSGPGIRVDSALLPSFEVSPFYDPLLAKVIAHGATREEAIHRLDRALADTVVLGVRTNIGFLRALLQDEDFRSATLRADALDAKAEALAQPPALSLAGLVAAASSRMDAAGGGRRRETGGGGEAPGPWDTLGGFRLSPSRRSTGGEA